MPVLWKKIKVCVPINMALVKYWGKRDDEFMLPLNDSVSLTVDALFAETEARIILVPSANDTPEHRDEDSVVLNEEPIDLSKNHRFERCFSLMRKLLREKYASNAPEKSHYGRFVFAIESVTNFPVKAGLASSAAGFAAIAYALGTLLQFTTDDIATVARHGSGSACRSVYAGLTQWLTEHDASHCRVLAPLDHWPDLVAVVVVVSDVAKAYGSSDGMALSVRTSRLLEARIALNGPCEMHMKRIVGAYLSRDFAAFAEYVMRDSNQLHAICMDTYPPLMYLNDCSRQLISFVNAFNDHMGTLRVAYTFDAGANACLLLERAQLGQLLATLCHYFPPPAEEARFIRGHQWLQPPLTAAASLKLNAQRVRPDVVNYLVLSTLGGGPRVEHD